MDSFELNKIIAAILVTVLLVFGIGKISDVIFKVEKPPIEGYKVEVKVASATGTEGDSQNKVDIASLLALGNIEDGKKVKLSTAENYATILRCNLNELAGDLSIEEADRVTVDISSTQIFGSCSINLLRDWRSHYTIDDVPPWDDLDIVRGTEREMTKCFKSSTLKPASIDQLFNCAPEYRSTIQSFLQDGSNSHGFGGEKNQVPFIRLDLIWMVQPALNPDEIVIKKLEQVQEELSNANSSLSGQIAHSAESMIQQLKTNSKIKELRIEKRHGNS